MELSDGKSPRINIITGKLTNQKTLITISILFILYLESDRVINQ